MSAVIALVLGALVLVWTALLLLTFVRATRLPANNPARVGPARKRRVAFLGASLTHGKVSADWTGLVGKALDVDVVNAGVNGDLAYNALQRIDAVLGTKPDALVVLVGTNDVMAGLDDVRAARYMRTKRLPERPSLDWYAVNLDAIATKSAGLRLVFCTLPFLGEDLSSPVNDRVRSYNDVIRAVAAKHGAALVDVYAALAAALPGTGRGFDGAEQLMLRAMFLRHALGWDFQRISARFGFALLVDAIHGNEAAARIIADVVAPALA